MLTTAANLLDAPAVVGVVAIECVRIQGALVDQPASALRPAVGATVEMMCPPKRH